MEMITRNTRLNCMETRVILYRICADMITTLNYNKYNNIYI